MNKGIQTRQAAGAAPYSLMHISLPKAMRAILSSRMEQNKSGSESAVAGMQITPYRCPAKITN